MSVDLNSPQYSIFKDSLARRVLSLPGFSDSSSTSDTDELDEFVSYLASEVWPAIPPRIRDLTHASTSSVPTHEELTDVAGELDVPASFSETLVSYGLIRVSGPAAAASDLTAFLLPILSSYLAEATAAPQQPNWSATRSLVDGCELCGRDVPLTYHHLIPKSVHEKAVKRGWHEERMLGKVAWLCR